MRKTHIALSTVALIALAVPAVMAAPKSDQALSITSNTTKVTFGNNLLVTGDLTGGDVSRQKITLTADAFPYEGDYKRVDTVATDAAGRYGFTLKPSSSSKYRSTAKGGVESAELTVAVRVAVALTVSDKTPAKGDKVMFSGTVRPAHDGKVIRIQRKTSSGWKNISKTTLIDGGDEFSTYSKNVRISKSGRYRARFRPGDGDHAPGNSAAVRLTTH